MMPSNHLILHHPLLLLPSIFPSIRVFPNESVLCIRWPKCWSFSFRINPTDKYSGLISFRIDLFDLLAVQGILKSLLQQHSSKELIFLKEILFLRKKSCSFNKLSTTGQYSLFITRSQNAGLFYLGCHVPDVRFSPLLQCNSFENKKASWSPDRKRTRKEIFEIKQKCLKVFLVTLNTL